MKNHEKSRDQLMDELLELRRQMAEIRVAEEYQRQCNKKLTEQVEYLQALLNDMNEFFLTFDTTGSITLVNKRVPEVLGYGGGELLGTPVFEYIHHLDKERVGVYFHSRIGEGITGSHEISLVHKDGSPRVVRINASPIIKNGLVIGGSVLGEDITDRKRIEKNLIESEETYRTIFENTGTAMLIVEEDTVMSLANSRIEGLLGFSKEEIENKKSWMEFVVGDDLEKMSKYHFARRKHPILVPPAYEFKVIDRNGNIKDIYLNVAMIPGTKKSVVSLTDITERKRIEKELKESEETYRTIFENTGTAMLIVEENTVVSLANSRVEELTGYFKEEIENKKSWTEFVPVDDLEKMKEYHSARRKDPASAPAAYEFKLIDRKGNVRDIYLNIALITGTKKSVVSLLDITERKSMEQKLAQSEETYRTIFENTGTAMSIIEDNMIISLGNSRMEKLTGYSREEIENKGTWKQLVLEEDLEKFIGYHTGRRSDPGSAPTTYEFGMVVRNGEVREVLMNIAMIPGTRKSVASFLDITERKQTEMKLSAANEELEATLEELRATEDELRYQISQLREKERQIRHVSLHDSITGLHNRVYFEEEMRRMESGRHNPVGLIICDVDGLKLVNDTLGHNTGDTLLAAAARVIRDSFRGSDVVARVGGDEFAVVLPSSSLTVVEESCRRIEEAVTAYNTANPELPLSISVGFAVRNDSSRGMDDLFKEADNNMYRKKLHSSRSARSAIVQTLMKAIEARDYITEGHAERLQGLAAAMALVLGLPERNVNDLRLLAQFHDIGKVGIPDRILFKPDRLTPEEFEEMRRHSEIGHRIAQSAPDMVPIADWILMHHEWWNGKGYPLGLKGEDIPPECRILAIADAYDAMTSDRPYRKAMSHELAMAELRRCAGTQFDPSLIEKFALVLESLRTEK